MTEKATADDLLDNGTDLFNKGEWDSASDCYDKAKKIYEILGDKQGISNTLIGLGNVYRNKCEWERTIEFYEKSLKISEELRDKQGISNALIGLGNVYQNRGEWEHAIEFYEKSLKIFEELGGKQGISTTLGNLGNVYSNKGEWVRAIEFYEKSLKIFEELGDKQGISNALNNLGCVYQNRGEWERAIEFYEKSLKISEELGDKQGISVTLGNFGDVYSNKGEWVRAIEFYEKSLKISEELGDKQGISVTLVNIGELQIKNGNWDEAKKNLKKALEISEKLAPILTVDVLANLGELFRLEEQFSDAFTNLQKAISIAVQVGLKPEEIDIYEKLGDTHLDQFVGHKIEDNLTLSEKFYYLALKLAKSLNMPLQEATAIRGIGVVQAKKRDLAVSKKSFMNAIEILRRLGAHYELQKTLLEYAKVLYETNVLVEAEMMAKTSAFDALRHDYRELLVKLYLLLGDIEMRRENQYEYYLDALKTSEFNPKIYVRTCFTMIFRMKTMEKKTLLKFIGSLKEVNKNRDKYFDQFLEALNAKIEGRKYKIADLPSSLELEIKSF